VLQMGIQSQDEGGAFLHEANTRMLSAVDAPGVPFGLTEPAFEVQIVLRQIKNLAARKQARLETGHHPSHLGADRIAAPLEPLSQRGELRFALSTAAVRRSERGRHGSHLVHITAYLREGFFDWG
jgi:hypothetical protein